MPVINPDEYRFAGSRNGPDNVAREKTSWQAALRQQAVEDMHELRAIRDLLESGCSPASIAGCDACRAGVHDGDPCLCCAHTD